MNAKTIFLAIIFLIGLCMPLKADASFVYQTSYPLGSIHGNYAQPFKYRYNNYWIRPSPSYANRARSDFYNPYNHPLNHFTPLNRICYGCGRVFSNPYHASTAPFGYYMHPYGSPYSTSNVAHFGSPGRTTYRSTTSPFQATKAFAANR